MQATAQGIGKCDKCDSPAIGIGREAIFDGYEHDAQGKAWAKYKPGEIRHYCAEHKPRKQEVPPQ
jgi:hypothetical protein